MPNDSSVTETPTIVAHTPGPWTCAQGSCEGQQGEWWNVDGAPEPSACDPSFSFSRGVCMVYGHEGAGEANARLIAAAPSLLDAAKAMLAQFEAGGFVRNTDSDGCSDWALKAAGPLRDLALLKAAVVKAEGGVL